MITRFKSALRLVGLLLVCSQSLACANILGIDEPVLRSGDTGGAGGAGGSPEAGAAGEGEGSIRPLPQIQGKGSNASQVGLTPNHLVIDGPHSVSGCPDSPTEIKLSVGGGDGKYSWEIDPPDPTFVLKEVGTDRAQAVLTGTLGTKARTLTVRARDNTGASNVITTQLKVANIPVIEPPALGSVCQDELYALDLHASGGDEAHYVWSTDDLPASSGLTLSADGHLAGKFTGVPSGPSQLKFTVNVADGTSCIAAPAKVSLTVNGAGASVCPTIGLQGQLQTPALCLGGEYNQQFKVSGGTAPYVWTTNARPSGLTLDSSGKVTGTYVSNAPKPVPPAAFTVQVTDSNGRTIEHSELVPVRDKCWFAYVAKTGSAAQLNFFDPVLGNRKAPPNAAVGEIANDFKFSPDGRYIAYRLTSTAGVAQLSVVDLFTWKQDSPGFPGVTQYAWSTDSSTLAVAYTVGLDNVVGGLDVEHGTPGAGSSISFPRLLPALTNVDSALTWFGPAPQQLAFIVNVGSFPLLRTFSLTPGTGFISPVLQSDSLAPTTRLKSASNGVFAIPEVNSILFYPSDGSFVSYHDDIVIAPSGQYVARAEGASLNVFRPSDDSTEPPPVSHTGCDSIGAWAQDRERIACVRKTASSVTELAFFDLSPTADPNVVGLNPTANVPLQLPDGRRRVFSASGDLFAFADDHSVEIVTLPEIGPVAVEGKPSSVSSASAGATFAELAFAPNEKLLLQHRGSRLSFFDLQIATSPEITMSDALDASVKCDEDFRNVTVGWCGAERPGAPFLWSPSSDLAAFQAADGTLHIYKFFGQSDISVDQQCGLGCVVAGQFDFQP